MNRPDHAVIPFNRSAAKKPATRKATSGNPAATPPDLQQRINARAWELAQGVYEDYRKRMAADTFINNYGRAPEKWLPEYAHIEAIRKAEAVAQVALGLGDAMREEARNLATMMGVDYREITGKE